MFSLPQSKRVLQILLIWIVVILVIVFGIMRAPFQRIQLKNAYAKSLTIETTEELQDVSTTTHSKYNDVMAFKIQPAQTKRFSSSNSANITSFTNNSTTLEIPARTNQLVYTRLLKCGSSTMLLLMQIMAKTNNYSLVHEFVGSTFWYKEESWLIAKSKAAQKWHEPWLYTRHLHFVDFIQYGNWTSMPSYFSLIRDPVERMISWYYYKYRIFKSREISLDACIADGLEKCLPVYRRSRKNFSIISFFCGHDDVCRYANEASLQRAKANVEMYYNVIGLQEDFTSFLETLEIVFPNYFSGVLEVYKKYQKIKKNQTSYKPEVTQETKDKMKAQLGMEYDFYNFVKLRFYNLYSKVKTI